MCVIDFFGTFDALATPAQRHKFNIRRQRRRARPLLCALARVCGRVWLERETEQSWMDVEQPGGTDALDRPKQIFRKSKNKSPRTSRPETDFLKNQNYNGWRGAPFANQRPILIFDFLETDFS